MSKKKRRTYEVQGTVKVEAAVTFTVTATSAEEAEEKGRLIVEQFFLRWEGIAPKEVTVEWEETDQSSEIEDVSEVEE